MSKVQPQQLRIIGGQWRSRKLNFPDQEGLRPTLDRVRETVFNWLQFDVEGRAVLDLFAGSGALGLEALSRGAKSAIFVENNPVAAKQLKHNLTLLQADNALVESSDAVRWLATHPDAAELVFLDPPFHGGLLQPALDALQLTAGSLVYVEHESGLKPNFPTHWQERKVKLLREFAFRLFEVQ